jgi:hypothetical protein
VLFLGLLSLLSATLCSAATPDEKPAPKVASSQLDDPIYLKFVDVDNGSFIKLAGRVGSIQASHSSYSNNTFFVEVRHLLPQVTCSRKLVLVSLI